MPLFLDVRPGIAYRGFDIVPANIAENRAHHAGRMFDVLDITRDVQPPADLILCRDLLNHLPFADVRAALRNMHRYGARLLLASNTFGRANIGMSGLGLRRSRHLDITGPPLDAPQPDPAHALSRALAPR
jgi:hypothetical protein